MNTLKTIKSKPIVLALALVCALALVGGSIAAYTVTSTAQNTVATSNLAIELEVLDANGVPTSSNAAIMPGETVDCTAQVKNTGKEPAWIRVEVIAQSNDDAGIAADNPFVTLEDLDDGTNWTPGKDGDSWYFYYNTPLEPGKTTEPLFKAVTAREHLDEANQQINLHIYAYATQYEHNGSTAQEAQGWA